MFDRECNINIVTAYQRSGLEAYGKNKLATTFSGECSNGRNMAIYMITIAVLLTALPITSVSGLRVRAQRSDCAEHQYYDPDRLVCLDRCGMSLESKCSVDQFCSSFVKWAQHRQPPSCLSYCGDECDTSEYCDHVSKRCLHCANVCYGTHLDECRMHCYDIFVGITTRTSSVRTTSTIAPGDPCARHKYYDEQRQICLDRCGPDYAKQCTIGYFCNPIANSCQSYCHEQCDHQSYCEHLLRQCLPCTNVCSDQIRILCRIYCYNVFVALLPPPSTTSSKPYHQCRRLQFYDSDHKLCIDLCGPTNNIKCKSVEFCSRPVDRPSVCLSYCPEACDNDFYCDIARRLCLPCRKACAGSDMKACQTHCDVESSVSRYVGTLTTSPNQFDAASGPKKTLDPGVSTNAIAGGVLGGLLG